MKNKCTLIIDGNWLLQSRMAPMIDRFNMTLDESLRESASQDLQFRLSYSITGILNRFKCIDNIILVTDGGSWRKKLPVPPTLHDVTYKGNRERSAERDWSRIFRALNTLEEMCKEIGITTSRYFDTEGDDWCWYWSRRLNAEGTHCIIWTIDNDLKQLIQVDGGSFTAWYNDRSGLFLHDSLKEKEMDDIEFFLTADSNSPVLDELRRNATSTSYIDPNSVILDKIICGDNSDNIKSVVLYTKNGRNRRISENECNKLLNHFNITNIQELISNRDTILCYLMNKYQELDLNLSDLQQRFDYNKRLVWLDESTIPETIQSKMCEFEYKLYDVNYIRNNASVLTKQNENIENIFDGINF